MLNSRKARAEAAQLSYVADTGMKLSFDISPDAAKNAQTKAYLAGKRLAVLAGQEQTFGIILNSLDQVINGNARSSMAVYNAQLAAMKTKSVTPPAPAKSHAKPKPKKTKK